MSLLGASRPNGQPASRYPSPGHYSSRMCWGHNGPAAQEGGRKLTMGRWICAACAAKRDAAKAEREASSA